MGFTTISSTQLSCYVAQFLRGSARVKSIYVAHSGTAGTVVLRDNGATGTVRCTINTAAAIGEYQTIDTRTRHSMHQFIWTLYRHYWRSKLRHRFLRLINHTIKGKQ